MTAARSMRNDRRAAALRISALEEVRRTLAVTPREDLSDDLVGLVFAVRVSDGYSAIASAFADVTTVGAEGFADELLRRRRETPDASVADLLGVGDAIRGAGHDASAVEVVAASRVLSASSHEAELVHDGDDASVREGGGVLVSTTFLDLSDATFIARPGTNRITGEPSLVVSHLYATDPVAFVPHPVVSRVGGGFREDVEEDPGNVVRARVLTIGSASREDLDLL